MEITYHNRNDADYERLFDELICHTFGFSFAPWLAMRLWDARYESYSIIENGRMISNICLFKTELVLNGHRQEAYQLGAVATRQEERNKGLSKKLMHHILDARPNTPMFLFANESVLDFYPRFGFKRVYESKPSMACHADNPNMVANRLVPNNPLVKAYLVNNRPYSDALYCDAVETVEMFHLLLAYRNDIYHIPALDTLVVAQKDGKELFIAYMNKPADLSFYTVLRHLPFTGIRTVAFGFMPDLLRLPCRWSRMEAGNEAMFIKGNINLPEPFAFPALAKT